MTMMIPTDPRVVHGLNEDAERALTMGNAGKGGTGEGDVVALNEITIASGGVGMQTGLGWVDASFVVEVGGRTFGGSAEFWEQFTRECGNFVRREGSRVVYRSPLDIT